MSDFCPTCFYARQREEVPTPSFYCLRYPPTTTGVLVTVLSDDWCGEYKLGSGSGTPGGVPVNVDVPYASQTGTSLHCTSGNWTGAPTTYSYMWVRDAVANVGVGATYNTTPADVGHTLTCVVKATNAAGTTTAPPSNGVVVTAGAETRR